MERDKFPELRKMVISYEIAEHHLARLTAAYPDIEFVVCTDPEMLPDALNGAQALVGHIAPQQVLKSPGLRWVQSISAGMDRYLIPELVEHEVLLTNFSGVQASNIAEHVLTMMLMFARGMPRLIHNQARGTWTQAPDNVVPKPPQTVFYTPYTFELGYQTLAIAGLGDIGCALAQRAKGIGMRVIGSKRRPEIPVAGVDLLFSTENWREMLADADHVAICLPLTPETYHLFGAIEFAAMKDSAYIYNTSRGTIIDQDVLIKALQSEQIAGAGLDVTTPEPLPAESPLWHMPNVLITCHTSGASPHTRDRGTEIVLENIGRYLSDQPLINVVDKQAGY